MSDPVLHYVYDPLCGWCYAAAPLVRAARSAGIAIRLHGGRLWPEPATLAPAKADHIRASDARIASATGQAFGPVYTDGLLRDPEATFWSGPPVAAVLAAGRVRAGADVDMLHAIQTAHYVEGRSVVLAGVLTELAADLCLDAHAFGRAFDLDDATDHAERTSALMARLGMRGYPGFAVEAGEALVRLRHEDFYGAPEAFAAAVASAGRPQAA